MMERSIPLILVAEGFLNRRKDVQQYRSSIKSLDNVESKAAYKQISVVDYQKPEDDLDDLEFDDVQDFHSRLALVQNKRLKKNDEDEFSSENAFENEELLFDEDDYIGDEERDEMEKRVEKVGKLLDQLLNKFEYMQQYHQIQMRTIAH